MLGLLQLILAAGRQTFSRSVDVELHHANSRTQSLRADFLSRHDASDRFRAFCVQAFWWIRGNRFDLAAPAAISAFAMRLRFTRRRFILVASNSCGSHFLHPFIERRARM